MLFFGRVRETNKIIGCLNRRDNVILTGSYGIGRTSLIRNIADLLKTDWKFVFVDFSRTPGEMARKTAAQLIAPEKFNPDLSYKKARFLLSEGDFSDSRHPVIVLDNISSFTGQKISFLNHITFERRFSFIAIAESSFTGQVLFRLRSCLFPARLMRLGYLNRKDTIEFVRASSKKYGLDWDDARMKSLAFSTKGYPLSIREMINREIENKKRSDA